jgi:hypothetical protein
MKQELKQKTWVIIVHGTRIDFKEPWYLSKGNPRRSSTGSYFSAMTPQLKAARKFKSHAAAAQVLKEFTPGIFDGSEKIIELSTN